MKILADENIDRQVVERLRTHGHEVLYIAECDPGIDDLMVLLQSRKSNAVLLTADKDFGEIVFRQRQNHTGVVLLRLSDMTPEQRADAVVAVFESHGEELRERFAVLSRRALRLRIMPG